MIPLLLISSDLKELNKYLKNLREKDSYFYEIEPENKEYSIKDIKTIIKEVNFFHNKIRIYYLKNFQNSSIEAQNSLLKLLEEPPKNVLFVLTADNQEKIIPTIRSRTKILYLGKKESLKSTPLAKEALNKLIKSKKFIYPDLEINFNDIIVFFHERLKTDIKASLVIKETLKLMQLLENNNLNKELALDHILIFIWRLYNN